MDGFDELERDLLALAEELNSAETKKFMKRQGNKLRKKTADSARYRVKSRTGKFEKSIKSGKVYDYDGAKATRVYSGARHAHLIEHGHNIVAPNGEVKGYQKGAKVFESAKTDFEEEFEESVAEYIDELCKKHGF